MVCIRGSLREGAPRSGGGECVRIKKYYFTPALAPSVTASLKARRATFLSEEGFSRTRLRVASNNCMAGRWVKSALVRSQYY